MTARLLIDAGNTRLKWAVADASGWRAQGACDYADWSDLEAVLADVRTCVIASVAGAERTQYLSDVLARAGVAAVWLQAAAVFGDLRNGYDDPGQLGVDRWMGLIAARARTREPVLVVSAGTALTADALAADGTFLGGVIVPGLALMRQALRDGTAGVDPAAGSRQVFPRTTADAVHSGMVGALCGCVRQQYDYLAAHAAQAPRCFMTGGDAAVLAPHLELPVEIVPALVLEGIERVAREGSAR